MSSVNLHFTMKYSQPAEYHFSHDSVFLARFVFEWVQKNPGFKLQSLADLCSGCGIIGLDFLFHLHQHNLAYPSAVDFIEVQNIYKDHFEMNQHEFKKHTQFDKTQLDFLNLNYAELNQNPSFYEKYDLIICNPPYFQPGHGKLSPSEFKNRCRFYLDSDFKTLIQSIRFSLSNQGVAFVLLRSLADHDIDYDLKSLSETFQLDMQNVGSVRGTDVLRIQKKEL